MAADVPLGVPRAAHREPYVRGNSSTALMAEGLSAQQSYTNSVFEPHRDDLDRDLHSRLAPAQVRTSQSRTRSAMVGEPNRPLPATADPEQPVTPPHASGQGGDNDEIDIPDSIKLGLGDFIFYSMLVGRAAMYDYMTAYLAIVAGLGLTLLCLAVFKKALPALPFSIALGVLFYFVTRLVLEPFLVPLMMHYTYF